MNHTLIPSPLFAATCIGAALAFLGMPFLSPALPEVIEPTVAETPIDIQLAPAPKEVLPILVPGREQRIALETRPLFSATRTPAIARKDRSNSSENDLQRAQSSSDTRAERKENRAPEKNITHPELKLSGLFLSDGKARALFAGPGSGIETWHEVGDIIDGWKIVSIEHDTVHFKQNEVEFVVKLSR